MLSLTSPLVRPALPVLVGFLVVSLTGCVSNTYKRADKSTPPAVPLGWGTTTPPTELTLQTLVVYQGPGSWKANAYWDEYGVMLRNRGETLVTIDSASLEDFQGHFAAAGDKPWVLEKLSRTRTEKLNSTLGNVVRVGSGILLPVTGGMVISTGAAMVAMVGGSVSPLLLAGPVMVPVAIGATIYRNVSSRHRIEEEFARRRLVLPLTLEPGQEVAGSLFFPVTPGPRRLTLNGREGQRYTELTLSLPELGKLHLNPKPEAVAKDIEPELRPILRNRRHWLTLAIDTTFMLGAVEANGQGRINTPAELLVEVDAQGQLIEDLNLVATSVSPRGNSTSRRYNKSYPAGLIPPAKITFNTAMVQEIPFASAVRISGP